MKPSDYKISLSVEGYDEKTAENYQNCYIAESFKIITDIDSKCE